MTNIVINHDIDGLVKDLLQPGAYALLLSLEKAIRGGYAMGGLGGANLALVEWMADGEPHDRGCLVVTCVGVTVETMKTVLTGIEQAKEQQQQKGNGA
jgi:hypothetical protein